MNEGKEMIPKLPASSIMILIINQSPMKIETVKEVLYQVKLKSQAIGLHCSDLVS